MYLADYHTHTRFSPDGSATMTEMAQAALDAGMDEFALPTMWSRWCGAPRSGTRPMTGPP